MSKNSADTANGLAKAYSSSRRMGSKGNAVARAAKKGRKFGVFATTAALPDACAVSCLHAADCIVNRA